MTWKGKAKPSETLPVQGKTIYSVGGTGPGAIGALVDVAAGGTSTGGDAFRESGKRSLRVPIGFSGIMKSVGMWAGSVFDRPRRSSHLAQHSTESVSHDRQSAA